ncbi:MAG: phosphatase PAP2 family protein [Mycoplasmataceae bacterium]|nr:phosphatase PAP2 family protein [Mycoplasmataceae bacterium]
MIKKEIKTNKIYYLFFSFIAIACLLLLVGTFFDWQISEKIVTFPQEKSFGTLASFSAGPIYTIIVSTFCMNIIFFQPFSFKNKTKKALYYFFASLICLTIIWHEFDISLVSEIKYTFFTNDEFLAKKWVLLLWSLLGVVVFVGCYVTVFLLLKNKGNKKNVWNYSLYALITLAILLAVIDTTKHNIQRERFFSIYLNHNNDKQYFKNWYSLFWDYSGTTSFAYQSFPSGHTNWACSLLVLIPLFYFQIKNKAIKIIAISLVYLFILLIMFSRVQGGYHYVSDVAMSLLICSIGNLCSHFIFSKLKNNVSSNLINSKLQ